MDLRSKASQWTQQLNIKRKFLKWFTLYFPSSLADGFLYSVNKNRQQNVRKKEKNSMKKNNLPAKEVRTTKKNKLNLPCI